MKYQFHLFAFFLALLAYRGQALAYPGQACVFDSECTGFGGISESCNGGACHGQAGKTQKRSPDFACQRTSVLSPLSLLMFGQTAQAEVCQANGETCRTSNDCCSGSMCHDMNDGKGSVCW